MYSLGIDLYLEWRISWIMRIRKTQISKLTWNGDKLSPYWVDEMSCLSTDPKYVHNSSTTLVNKMYDFLCPYKENKKRWRKSVQRNLTCNTSERKTRDFYTILSGCPQNWPIYPLYFSFDELFVDFELFLLQWFENWKGLNFSFQGWVKWTCKS